MQKKYGTLDDLIKVKSHLDEYYAYFLQEMENATEQAFAETYEHILVSLASNPEVLEAVSQQFARSETHEKIACALRYLFQRYSDKVVLESLGQLLEHAFDSARKKYEQHLLKRLAANPNAFISIYDLHSRFHLHLN
jgi:hypothetical protein